MGFKPLVGQMYVEWWPLSNYLLNNIYEDIYSLIKIIEILPGF